MHATTALTKHAWLKHICHRNIKEIFSQIDCIRYPSRDTHNYINHDPNVLVYPSRYLSKKAICLKKQDGVWSLFLNSTIFLQKMLLDFAKLFPNKLRCYYPYVHHIEKHQCHQSVFLEDPTLNFSINTCVLKCITYPFSCLLGVGSTFIQSMI